MTIIKQKVLAYVYRDTEMGREVLVFDHEEKYGEEVNPQVPAGTIDKNELSNIAVIRELFEESGLSFSAPAQYIGEFTFNATMTGSTHHRHVYSFLSHNLPDSWNHSVTGGDEDKGLIFSYYWLPIEKAKSKLVFGMGTYL